MTDSGLHWCKGRLYETREGSAVVCKDIESSVVYFDGTHGSYGTFADGKMFSDCESPLDVVGPASKDVEKLYNEFQNSTP